MFDMTLKFETKLKLKIVSKDFEMMFLEMGGAVPYTEQIVTHTMSIKNASAIPDKEWLDKSAKVIFETMVEKFKEDNTLNVEVVETVFIGYSDIIQKEAENA